MARASSGRTVVFQAFHFEGGSAVAAIARDHAAHAGHLLEPLPHRRPARPPLRRDTISAAAPRLCRFATESTATISPLLMMITLLQDCSTSERMCVLRMMV